MSSAAGGSATAFNAGVLISYTRQWYCPSCQRQHVTNIPEPHSPLHQCASMRGAWVPFLEHGVKGALRINRREDYVGSDTAWVDGDGEPVMSVTTMRDDGEDCTIFAPCVNIKVTADDAG